MQCMCVVVVPLQLQIGVCGALRELSDTYPMHKHASAWCHVSCPKPAVAVPAAGKQAATAPTATLSVSQRLAAAAAKEKEAANAEAESNTPSVSPPVITSTPTKSIQDSSDGQESPPKFRRFFGKSSAATSSSSLTAEKPKTGLFAFVSRSKSSSTTSTSKENATAVAVAAPSPAPAREKVSFGLCK